MKNSIRTRLFIQVSLIIIIFVVLTTIINSNFLEKYYIYKKKQVLIAQGNYIDSINEGDYKASVVELRKIESRYSIGISIISPNKQIKYSSSFAVIEETPYMFENMPSEFPMLPPYPAPPGDKNQIVRSKEVIDESSFFQIQTDVFLNVDFLVYYKTLKTGDTLDMRVFLSAISESAEVANTFILWISILLLLIGAVWVFVLSKNFTKPILEMNEITRRIAHLDFSKKCNIKTMDEINQLGDSINYLSEQLETSLTDLQVTNEKLQEDIEKERKIDEMRKEFISNISHELRTPISIIEGYAEGLKLNISKSQDKKDFYCDVIMEEVQNMDKLLRDLLDLSQIESGQLKLKMIKFDLFELINHLSDKYNEILASNSIKLEIIKQKNIMVYADSFRIEQILNNLINNAIAHIDGKRIIRINSERVGQKVVVSVYNTGKHISEEELEKLWISFYKADKARTREKGGYGLGLSIVKAIQQWHNNDYGVRNIDGGVEFWFEIGI